MRSIFLTVLAICIVLMLVALTRIVDFKEPRGVEEFKANWKAFRKTRSGKVWFMAWIIFVIVNAILILDEKRLINLAT